MPMITEFSLLRGCYITLLRCYMPMITEFKRLQRGSKFPALSVFFPTFIEGTRGREASIHAYVTGKNGACEKRVLRVKITCYALLQSVVRLW